MEEESEEEKCYQLSVKANVVNTEPVKNANDEIQDTKQEKNGNLFYFAFAKFQKIYIFFLQIIC